METISREDLDQGQRTLLDFITKECIRTHSWVPGLVVRVTYKDGIDGQRVDDLIKKMPQLLLRVSNDGYHITLRGALLSSEGPTIGNVALSLIKYLRARVLADPYKTSYDWKDIRSKLLFPENYFDYALLVIHLAGLSGSGNVSQTNFSYAYPREIEEIIEFKDANDLVQHQESLVQPAMAAEQQVMSTSQGEKQIGYPQSPTEALPSKMTPYEEKELDQLIRDAQSLGSMLVAEKQVENSKIVGVVERLRSKGVAFEESVKGEALLRAARSLDQHLRKTYEGFLQGTWECRARLGNGGQGAVRYAWNPETCSIGALKVVDRLSWRDHEQLHTRLTLERDSLGKARHPNIIRLLDYGEDPEPFLVTEVAPLGDLRNHLARFSGDIYVALRLLVAIGNALASIHEQGFIHRDVKPANIFLFSPDWFVLGDFGIAKNLSGDGVTGTSEFAGDAKYGAPELTEGKPCQASDVFSLGAVIHTMLRGGEPRYHYSATERRDVFQDQNDPRSLLEALLLKPMLNSRETERPTAKSAATIARRLIHRLSLLDNPKMICSMCGGEEWERIEMLADRSPVHVRTKMHQHLVVCEKCGLLRLTPA